MSINIQYNAYLYSEGGELLGEIKSQEGDEGKDKICYICDLINSTTRGKLRAQISAEGSQSTPISVAIGGE